MRRDGGRRIRAVAAPLQGEIRSFSTKVATFYRGGPESGPALILSLPPSRKSLINLSLLDLSRGEKEDREREREKRGSSAERRDETRRIGRESDPPELDLDKFSPREESILPAIARMRARFECFQAGLLAGAAERGGGQQQRLDSTRSDVRGPGRHDRRSDHASFAS